MKIGIDFTIGTLLLGILVLFLNPTHLLMPTTLQMMLIVGLIIGFLAFVSLVWREHPNDERELAHIGKASRWSFFSGASVLTLGIIIQALKHDIDPWLLYALSLMVLAKLLSRSFDYFRR